MKILMTRLPAAVRAFNSEGKIPSLRIASAIATIALLCLSSAPASAGLVAFYNFDDGTATDQTGHGYNGTISGATFTASGYEGGAFDFNGVSDFIKLGGLDINPSIRPQVTFGAWANTNVADRIRGIISHDDGGYDRNINIDVRGGISGVGYASFAGNQAVLRGGPATAPIGQWVFIAARSDQATGTLTLDVDGSRVTLTGVSFGSGLPDAYIGRNPSFNEFWDGRIDNAFFYDTFLSDAQIDAIRAGGAAAILPSAPPSDVPEPGAVATFGVAFLSLTGLIARRRGKMRQL